jgi:signal transduction histidine kinase/CheY-like chemotaxis protein
MRPSSSPNQGMLALALQTLDTLSGAGTSVDRMRRILSLIRDSLDLDLVGLHLEAGDKAPFTLIDGLQTTPSEPAASIGPEQCLCQRVRQAPAAQPAGFSGRGSFWTPDGRRPPFPEPNPVDPERCRSDCLCRRADWQSLAVIPLRVDARIVGLLQLLDRRPGRLTAESVVMVEQVASALSACLQLDQLDQELRRYRFKRADDQAFDGQSLQSQKLEAVGTLAGGIAHDFNNILWIITGNTELAISRLPKNHPARDNLDKVEEACQRAKDLVTQILSFSRPTDQEFKPLKISSVVRESLKLLRSSLPSTIAIRKVISAESALVPADLSQIHQALLNLYTNAAEAMRSSGGVLEVSLVDMDLSETEVQAHETIVPGRFAVLSVADTGPGIDPAIVQRIFDPYFSARKDSGGLGMGLAVVQGIVKNHGGAIRVQSKPGHGATFHIFLPCVSEPAPPAGRQAQTDRPLPSGKGRVLWVDDEPGVLDMGRQMLAQFGFHVTVCESASRALQLFGDNPGRFDVVITDQTMPQMTGEKLARRMMAIRPDIAIVMCTGYSEVFTEADAESMGIREYFQKPLDMESLAMTIQQIIEAS